MPSATFRVFNGGGDDHTGDAHVISGGPLNNFDPIQTTGWVGRAAKNSAEVNLFFAFDATTIALGSVIDGVNFEFTTSLAAQGTGGLRLGFLHQDGTWEVNGFGTFGVSPVPRYPFAFEFPNSGIAIPHASQDSSLTIEPGILAAGTWAHLADVTFSAFLLGDVTRVWGDGIGGETDNIEFIAAFFNIARSVNGYEIVALTIDSQSVGNALNRMNVYLTENANDDNRPRLTVEWTLNPPVFTSSPILDAFVGGLYVYDADADPYVLGDQTLGNFIDVVFSLPGTEGVDFPTGMTIDSGTGVVSWTPVVGQAGANAVTIRATNEGGEFIDQDFIVTVHGDLIVDEPISIATSAAPLTADPQGGQHTVTAATTGVKATAATTAVKVEAQGGPLSVTVSSGDITIEPD